MTSKQDQHAQQLEKKIREARHQSKSTGITFRDVTGRWIFELHQGKKREAEQ